MVAHQALFSFTSTVLNMSIVVHELDNLLTVSAFPRLHVTVLLMIFYFSLGKLLHTMFTCYFCMSFFVMLLFLCLGYHISTYLTFIVIPSTPNFMHSIFAHFNLSFTIRALLGRFNYSLIFHNLVILHFP
jgi:hypothetical protein